MQSRQQELKAYSPDIYFVPKMPGAQPGLILTANALHESPVIMQLSEFRKGGEREENRDTMG